MACCCSGPLLNDLSGRCNFPCNDIPPNSGAITLPYKLFLDLSGHETNCFASGACFSPTLGPFPGPNEMTIPLVYDTTLGYWVDNPPSNNCIAPFAFGCSGWNSPGAPTVFGLGFTPPAGGTFLNATDYSGDCYADDSGHPTGFQWYGQAVLSSGQIGCSGTIGGTIDAHVHA